MWFVHDGTRPSWWFEGEVVFVFQAEDGIRDLVRSRGLGDVYKRQHKDSMGNVKTILPGEVQRMSAGTGVRHSEFSDTPVSYTHLTLPTSDLV